MIVALDTNCILPGRVGGIESHVIGIIEALLADAPWLQQMILVTRAENDDLFRTFQSNRCTLLLQTRPILNGRPITNWAQSLAAHPTDAARLLRQFQQDKLQLLRRAGADVVHFPGCAMNPMQLDLPAVVTLHDLQHRRFPEYFTDAELHNRETYWRESARRADAVLTASTFAANDIIDQFDVPPTKLFVAIPAVRDIFSQPAQCDAVESIRHKLEGATRFFIYPAAPYPHKNHHRLLHAFAAARTLSSEFADMRLILTGGGQAESDIPGIITQLKLQDHVHLLGRVSDAELRALYSLARAMIFPSEYEGCGLPLIEAMASGCPVAAAKVASIPEIVGKSAVLFDPCSESAMAHVMLDLAADDHLRDDLSSRGRTRAKHFTSARFAHDLKAAYDAAIAVNARRAA
jgi:glycosyltransferase involved in cell wall biosynthesis